jgi:hypothetical protein
LSDDVSDTPTVTDNILYLMSELERAVQMSRIKESPVLVASILRRLEDLAETVRRIGSRQGS